MERYYKKAKPRASPGLLVPTKRKAEDADAQELEKDRAVRERPEAAGGKEELEPEPDSHGGDAGSLAGSGKEGGCVRDAWWLARAERAVFFKFLVEVVEEDKARDAARVTAAVEGMGSDQMMDHLRKVSEKESLGFWDCFCHLQKLCSGYIINSPSRAWTET